MERHPAPAMGTDGDALGARIGAFVIDQLIMTLPGAGLIMIGILLTVSGAGDAITTIGALAFLFGLFAFPVFGFVYKVALEAIYGATLGKRLFDIVVVTETGDPCGWKESLIRNVLYFLVDSGWIAMLVVLLTDDHQRIGDLLAETVVVREA